MGFGSQMRIFGYELADAEAEDLQEQMASLRSNAQLWKAMESCLLERFQEDHCLGPLLGWSFAAGIVEDCMGVIVMPCYGPSLAWLIDSDFREAEEKKREKATSRGEPTRHITVGIAICALPIATP